MLKSGNGRHRKPRQAPTAMVAVAATGAGIALPLFAASGAQAADTTTWNAVATCESGGQWSANSGNGFYGGLQITQQTWDEYGGEDYAKRPDLASQSEQIAVAEKILDAVGSEAWTTCAVLSGLTDNDSDSASASPTDEATDGATDDATTSTDDATDGATDTATTPTDEATDSGSDSSSSSDRGADDSTTATASPNPSSTEAGSSVSSATTPSASTGRHAKPEARAAWGELTRDTTGTTNTTKSAKNGTTGTGAGSTTDATSAKRYLVREGDSLCGIAAEEDVVGGWRALYEANKSVIGDDPSVIRAGEYLTVG